MNYPPPTLSYSRLLRLEPVAALATALGLVALWLPCERPFRP